VQWVELKAKSTKSSKKNQKLLQNNPNNLRFQMQPKNKTENQLPYGKGRPVIIASKAGKIYF
jgi:hypothetical protein